MDERILREKEFHNERFEKDTRKHLDKYYSITRNSRACYVDKITLNARGKTILEYGCGEGSFSFDLAKLGAMVYGIDISEVAIEKAKLKADAEYLSDSTRFEVMNAEEPKFDNGIFDRICGVAILHHLDLSKSLKELARMMKPAGNAVFWEPLGHNLFINLYRSLTKDLRTKDEHPLLVSDFEQFKKCFKSVEIRYFHLISLICVPLRNLRLFPKLIDFFDGIDSILFRIPILRRNAWYAVIELSIPQKVDDTNTIPS